MAACFDVMVQAKLEEIPGILFEVEQCMRTSSFSEEQILDMQLAVEEAATNIILHGYGSTPGTIALHGETITDRATIEISDKAPAYNPLLLEDPDTGATLDEREIGGLGVFLIRKVTDDASYHFEDGKNILTLVKKK